MILVYLNIIWFAIGAPGSGCGSSYTETVTPKVMLESRNVN